MVYWRTHHFCGEICRLDAWWRLYVWGNELGLSSQVVEIMVESPSMRMNIHYDNSVKTRILLGISL